MISQLEAHENPNAVVYFQANNNGWETRNSGTLPLARFQGCPWQVPMMSPDVQTVNGFFQMTGVDLLFLKQTKKNGTQI